jgi:hypothetical protein
VSCRGVVGTYDTRSVGLRCLRGPLGALTCGLELVNKLSQLLTVAEGDTRGTIAGGIVEAVFGKHVPPLGSLTWRTARGSDLKTFQKLCATDR